MSQNQQNQLELGLPKKESYFTNIAPYAVIGVLIASIIIFFSNRALGEEEFQFSERVLQSQKDVTIASDSLTLQEQEESDAYQVLMKAQVAYDMEAAESRDQEQILCLEVETSVKLMYAELEPYMTDDMATLHDIAEEARECKDGYFAPDLF